MFKILLIEDDKSIREELKIILENNGYEVDCIFEWKDIVEKIKEIEPHLIVLDINLPEEDGYQVCLKIRSFSKIPIIFVTSRNTDMDELKSITIGGDDFVTKPYNTSILLARIGLLLRRIYKENNSTKMLHHGIELDIEAGSIKHKNQSVNLTKNELKIMIFLYHNIGKIVQRADVIDYLWDNEVFIDDNTLSVNITRIRNKLKSIGVVGFIQTKHRQGYLIE